MEDKLICAKIQSRRLNLFTIKNQGRSRLSNLQQFFEVVLVNLHRRLRQGYNRFAA